MKILGIETVTRVGSLAVTEDGKVIGDRPIDTELNHAKGLITELDNLLNSINIDISDIEIIAVDRGPGSFTGIRVGIASAFGLAQPDNKKLIGVCSLEVLCYEILRKGIVNEKTEYLVPFIDAKRGGIYTGLYKVENSEIQIVKDAYLITLDKLLSAQSVPAPGGIKTNSYIFGPNIEMIRKGGTAANASFRAANASFRAKAGQKPVFPSAKTVALLAEEKIKCGILEKKLEPTYIYDVQYNRG